ncbi:MAG: DUF1122 family protein [Deltaproteobacteria bacterium]|nr:DUF1122 family protein [Deltaproteobacteria bacterium]
MTASWPAHALAELSGLPTHPLQALDGLRIGDHIVSVVGVRPLRRRIGWSGFTLALRWADHGGLTPVFEGIFSEGGRRVGSWMDLSYLHPSVDGSWQRPLFQALGGLVTSHLMVAYEGWGIEGAPHRETEEALRLGVPPAATPLGMLLYWAGCRGGWRDWYIAEGGAEGPRKLQAEKPLDEPTAQRFNAELVLELHQFLARVPGWSATGVEAACRARARALLAELGPGESAALRSLAGPGGDRP